MLDGLRTELKIEQGAGFPFVFGGACLASLICLVYYLPLSLSLQNMLTLCLSPLLLVFALIMGRFLQLNILDRSHPLSSLGLYLSINQMLYLLIVLISCNAYPQAMLLFYVIIHAGHFWPFAWLYKVKAYAYMSVAMTLLSLPIRLFFNNQGLALFLMTASWLFVLVLWQEYNNQQPRSQYEADLP